ncbi:MAG: hypothetical protein V3G42_06310 [Oscillospiraceae bacterium]
MKMLDRGTIGCEMCRRLPVPSEDDLQWMRSGQPLYSLVADAVAAPAESTANALEDIDVSGLSAVDAMDNAMNSLEELFGLTEPEKPSAPVAKASDDSGLLPVVEDDLKTDKIFYKSADKFFMTFGHPNIEIMYCPFCGSNLTQKT